VSAATRKDIPDDRELAFGAAALIWFIAIGLDRRMHASEVPVALQVLGWMMLVSSSGFILWVVRERTGIEERALLAGLPGYADYAAPVRYRLLSGLW
jgi:protein-S-isoprenylcysteine O-methyltransferase Ste14